MITYYNIDLILISRSKKGLYVSTFHCKSKLKLTPKLNKIKGKTVKIVTLKNPVAMFTILLLIFTGKFKKYQTKFDQNVSL